MSNLRVYMGGPPGLSEVLANAGHASLALTAYTPGMSMQALALHASVVFAAQTASTDAVAPPVVQSVTVSTIAETTVTITWTVDQFVTGQIEYGETVALGSTTTKETSFNYQTHIQSISGLSAGTQYYYRVVGENSNDDAYASDIDTFTTLGGTSSAGPRYDTYGGTTFPTFPTGSNVYVVPSNVNTRSEFQVWLDNSVPDGASTSNRNIIVMDKTLGGAGTLYTWDRGVQFRTRQYIDIWGYNAKIYNTTTSGAQILGEFTNSALWFGRGSQGHDIYGIEIQGVNNPSNLLDLYSYLSGENSHGVAVEGARDINLYDSWVHHVNGDGFLRRGFGWNVLSYIGNRTNWTQTSGTYSGSYAGGETIIQYNKFDHIGRQGIANIWGQDIRIQYNIIEDVAIYPIDFEDGDNNLRTMEQVRITDNVFRRWSYSTQWNPCLAFSMVQTGADLDMPIQYFEYARNWHDEGCMGTGNSTVPNSYFASECHSIFQVYPYNSEAFPTITTMVIQDNFSTLNANNNTCTRGDFGAVVLRANGTSLTITGNDLDADWIILLGTYTTESISGNNGSTVKRNISP